MNEKKNDKKKLRIIIISLIIIFIAIIGGIFYMNMHQSQVADKTKIVSNNKTYTYRTDEIKKNNQKDASFDFSIIQGVYPENIKKKTTYNKKFQLIGGIAIPNIKLNLPIIKGMSNEGMTVGAETMRPDQKMGKGNYPLASHNINKNGYLFSSLNKLKESNTIYLTDLNNIYIYKITEVKQINSTDVDIVDDHGKDEITLITCDSIDSKRLAVIGKFVKKENIKNITAKEKEAFDIPKNSWLVK